MILYCFKICFRFSETSFHDMSSLIFVITHFRKNMTCNWYQWPDINIFSSQTDYISWDFVTHFPDISLYIISWYIRGLWFDYKVIQNLNNLIIGGEEIIFVSKWDKKLIFRIKRKNSSIHNKTNIWIMDLKFVLILSFMFGSPTDKISRTGNNKMFQNVYLSTRPTDQNIT